MRFSSLLRHMARATCLVLATAATWAHAVSPPDELLEPEQAFRISTAALDERNVQVRFEIAEGYYMYRDRFKFETQSGRLLADVELPAGERKRDPFFGETQTYRRQVTMRVPVSDEDAASGRVRLKVTSQGCSDQGVCYTPLEQAVTVRLASVAAATPAASGTAPAARSATSPATLGWVQGAMLLAVGLAAAVLLGDIVRARSRLLPGATPGSRRVSAHVVAGALVATAIALALWAWPPALGEWIARILLPGGSR